VWRGRQIDQRGIPGLRLDLLRSERTQEGLIARQAADFRHHALPFGLGLLHLRQPVGGTVSRRRQALQGFDALVKGAVTGEQVLLPDLRQPFQVAAAALQRLAQQLGAAGFERRQGLVRLSEPDVGKGQARRNITHLTQLHFFVRAQGCGAP
jgi:hypothetical protein